MPFRYASTLYFVTQASTFYVVISVGDMCYSVEPS